ncbi:UDP-N-acetylmuramoylalanyl-D-glutamate--2,6-diaminopimelate ligase [Rhodococcus erythropolis]|uniref:UDP-N-acetylmuramoyl-L-alanyl-D-glutamate--2, 6-diaminopimelate ligase n=1 Tax=Rhodococcus erythropolis TaxID=1833 RepID=UPI0008761EBA|nr:UDP-N-acetylmuramoyl-L-alanyl-D-glutamate--2,6-diaminopimelate ligase [Rhodococcus erythropolis]SCY13484.1 UDP-N-acetylmuramoylalanyl-D-glutamate--2,6-diaminopimelate ligase [Rhodococcus erythropolis]
MPNRLQSSNSDGAPGTRPTQPVATAITALSELSGARLEWVGQPGSQSSEVVVKGVDLRAQGIVADDLFAALPGARTHGAQFAVDALGRGATAILTDEAGLELIESAEKAPDRSVPVLVHPNPRDVLGEISAEIYGRPSEKMQVVGITGTSGKTTTSYLLEAAIAGAGRKPGLVGTIETRIDGRRVPSALTTPEAPQLHALFAVMAEQGIDTVVMEVSSHALALGRVDGIRFDIGAFTNLSQDHLDFHRDFEEYFQAKARLFDPESTVRAEHAVVCVDDVWGRRMAELAATDESDAVTTVSTSTAEAEWKVGAVQVAEDGSQTFELVGPDGQSWPVSLRLPGRYNVANAALALTVSFAAGLDPDAAVRALGTVDVPGRVQRIDRGQSFLAVVDYAHKPAALEAVIATLRNQVPGRVAVVVGAGGDRDAGKRTLMGEAGARGADLLIVTDDNPRTEDPAKIRASVMQGAIDVPESERGEIREVGDRALAIEQAVRWAQPGDVVLVAGKGHEVGQEIDGVKHPFDDREVLGEMIGRFAINTAHGGKQ